MNPLVAETVEALRGAGWRIETASPPLPMPPHIAERFPDVPPLAVDFFTSLRKCVAPSEGWWLLTAADYSAPPDPDGYAWDSFAEIVNSDTDAAARAWWDRHLILFQLVNGDFEFLALCLDRDSPDFGKVVGTDLLDFDSAAPLASSYEDFLVQLRDVARRPPTRSAVYDNYLTLFVHEEIIEDGSIPPWERGPLARLRRWFGSRR
ncbi:MAG TPA: hypothetical protein VN231_10775 [Allosphingosinicella sp.]|nr:hypothetical protein [Allosphingosinicella sp.]